MMDFIKAYAVDGNAEMLAFSIRNAAKDVGYYGVMADDLGVDSIMSKCADRALKEAVADGRGDDMVSQLVDFHAARMGD